MTNDHVRVGDVLSLERRAVVVQPDAEYCEIGIRSFGRGIFHKDPISGTDLGDKRVFRIEPGDLVLSNVFAWEGAVAVASEAEAGRIGSHRFMTFVPADGRIETSWASWFIRSEPGLELIRQASPGSAGRNRTLAIDRFEALEIPLPPIEEQRRVAKELDRVAAAATEIAHRLDRASVLADALAVSASTRPDLDDDSRNERSWRLYALGEILEPSRAQISVEPSAHYRIAGVYSFGRGLIDRGVISGADASYKTLTVLSEGDIVVSKLNGWEGAVAVVAQDFDGHCVSSEYPTFKANRNVLLPAFFEGIARSPAFWSELNSNARGSMIRRRRINATEFLATHVWLPPMATQVRAAGHIATVKRVASAREVARRRLEALMPAVLNRAFGSVT